MAPIKAEELEKYVGARVVLHVSIEGAGPGEPDTEEVEGVLLSGNAAGAFLRKKGSSQGSIYEPHQIVDIGYAPQKLVKLGSKRMDPIEHGKARRHLALYHSVPLAQLNGSGTEEDPGMDEGAALEFHERIDHSDLAHHHAPKSASSDAAGSSDDDGEE